MNNDYTIHSERGVDIVLKIHCDDQGEYNALVEKLNSLLPTTLPKYGGVAQ